MRGETRPRARASFKKKKKKKRNRGAERGRAGPPKKMEKPGIDPGASSMLMTRSAI